MTTHAHLETVDAAAGNPTSGAGSTLVNWLLIPLLMWWLARRIWRAARAEAAAARALQARYSRIVDEYDLAAMRAGVPGCYRVPPELRRTDRDVAWRLATNPEPCQVVSGRRGGVVGAVVVGALVASALGPPRRH